MSKIQALLGKLEEILYYARKPIFIHYVMLCIFFRFSSVLGMMCEEKSFFLRDKITHFPLVVTLDELSSLLLISFVSYCGKKILQVASQIFFI